MADELIAKIVQLMAEQGISNTDMEQFVDVAHGTVSQWKKGSNKSYKSKHLPQIAKRLGVTPNDLLSSNDLSNAYIIDKNQITMIPLYGSVSAGFGACAVDLVEGYIPVYNVNAEEAENTIAITVHGDSMSPKIEDGDIIVVHKQDSVDSGTVAVVFLDGDAAMVKRVIYDKTHIELLSLNPTYSPMVFTDSEVLRVRVVGKVTEVHKKL